MFLFLPLIISYLSEALRWFLRNKEAIWEIVVLCYDSMVFSVILTHSSVDMSILHFDMSTLFHLNLGTRDAEKALHDIIDSCNFNEK